jgi:hypothetical protein
MNVLEDGLKQKWLLKKQARLKHFIGPLFSVKSARNSFPSNSRQVPAKSIHF